MGKFKELQLEENYTVGDKVRAFSHRQCINCASWCRFDYDLAKSEIEEAGYFKLVCPVCEYSYVFDNMQYLPKEHMIFRELP